MADRDDLLGGSRGTGPRGVDGVPSTDPLGGRPSLGGRDAIPGVPSIGPRIPVAPSLRVPPGLERVPGAPAVPGKIRTPKLPGPTVPDIPVNLPPPNAPGPSTFPRPGEPVPSPIFQLPERPDLRVPGADPEPPATTKPPASKLKLGIALYVAWFILRRL